MVKILVIAPHPDDETLGCAGTLLKHKKSGDEIHWLIVTSTVGDKRYPPTFTEQRKNEIELISKLYGFSTVNILNFKPATLDVIPLSDVIEEISTIIKDIKPKVVYLPYRGDAHSDHKVVFDASVACTKSFRNHSIKAVRVYETLSETDFGCNPDNNGFRPNYFVNVERYLDKKIEILNVFASEMKAPPFPRNEESVRALALLRGPVAGAVAAEAFMSLKEIWDD